MRRIVLVCLLLGCNQVFGLKETIPLDATPPMADVLPATCTVSSDLEPFAATYLEGTTSHGKDTEVITNGDQPALFTYPIDGQVGPNQHIAAAILKVAPITMCGMTACQPCPSGATTYQLYWNLEDWTEGQETYTKTGNGGMWAQPGAAGATDRSAQIVEAPLPTGPQLLLAAPMIDVARVPAKDWIGTHSNVPYSRISVQLRTNDWAAFASDDHDESQCGEAAGVPTLTLTVCDD